MKTLTEFSSIALKNAAQSQKSLTEAGKTAEEMPAALGEALKLEGDKLTWIIAALETVGDKFNDLKRVVVASLNEGETAPSGAKLVGDKYFTVEYYGSRVAPPKEDPRGGRDGKRGGGRGRDGKRGGPGGPGRGDRRPPRGDGKAPTITPKGTSVAQTE